MKNDAASVQLSPTQKSFFGGKSWTMDEYPTNKTILLFETLNGLLRFRPSAFKESHVVTALDANDYLTD